MNFLVDIGNSRLKWACLTGSKLQNHGSIEYTPKGLTDVLSGHWQGCPVPRQVSISSVAGEEVAKGISAVVKRLWNIHPVFARVERERCGVVNAYRDVTQLGIDRWLAMIAAWNRYLAPVCVVDCGTAITIDGVSAGGRHLGGLIIPGLELMQKSLINRAQGIKADIGFEPELAFGRSTPECLGNGAGYAVASLIDRVAGDLETGQGGSLCRVITGGHAEFINGLLLHKFDYHPDLVLNGLARSLSDHG
ncbi:MAG: type III pantothenate kinase [Gammaproteobacteria bacterium]